MKKLILISTILLGSFGFGQIEVTDAALKQCFLDDVPALMNADSTLDTTSARAYTNGITCTQDDTIRDISILEYFSNTTELDFRKIILSDLSPLFNLNYLKHLSLEYGSIDSLPDMSGFNSLETIKVEWVGLKYFPLLPQSIRNVALKDNEISQVEIKTTMPNLELLALTTNQIDTFCAMQYLPVIENILVGDNNIRHIESFADNDSLTIVRVFNNPIQNEITGLGDKMKLEIVSISNIELYELPDIPYEILSESWIALNRLTFEDLLPLVGDPNFPAVYSSYDNQREQGDSTLVEKLEHETFSWTLDFDQSVNTNYYKWYKNGNLVDSTTTGTFEIVDLTPDQAGEYTCKVGNTLIPGMVIDVNPINLKVEATVDLEESTAFSPNNDGAFDTFYIKEAGTVQIISEKGTLVKTLTGPTYWDGSDNDGSRLPFGYYIVTPVNGERYGVTIVR